MRLKPGAVARSKEVMEGPLLKVRLGGTDVWIETDARSITEPAPQRTSAEEQAAKALDVGERLTATIRAYCEMLVETFQGLHAEKMPNKVTACSSKVFTEIIRQISVFCSHQMVSIPCAARD
jgi:hypothetical protein